MSLRLIGLTATFFILRAPLFGYFFLVNKQSVLETVLIDAICLSILANNELPMILLVAVSQFAGYIITRILYLVFIKAPLPL